MNTKAIEIRDVGTFIPAMAIQMVPSASPGSDEGAAEFYLLRRAGFNLTEPPFSIILCRMEASGVDRNATYDPFAWGTLARTMHVAHCWIEEHWDEIRSGDVIDVEFIVGERAEPKLSERLDTP